MFKLASKILLSLSITACFLVGDSFAETAPKKIKVGAIFALTGDAANFGNAAKNGVELALENLDPEIRKRIEVIYEDDRAEPKLAVSAFKKLINLEDIDVLINTSSGTGKAISSMADKEKVPFIAIATDKEVVEGRSHVVNLWVTPEAEAELAARESIKRGYKRIARISAIHEFCFNTKREFDRASGDSIKVVLDEEYQKTEKDFRPFLNKLKQAGEVDAIFVNLFLGQIGIFARQVREMGIEAPLFAFEFFEDPSEIELSQGALLDQWYVQADDPTGWFLKAYNKKFPNFTHFAAANGYDAIMLIAKAMKENPEDPKINTLLHSLKDFSGALGTYSATDDNRFSLSAAVKVVTKDGVKKVG